MQPNMPSKRSKTTSSVVCAPLTSNGPPNCGISWKNQAATTLNSLCKSSIDPTKSAFHQLNGHKYDWNAFPMAPPGTRAVVYISADGRTSWGTRGIDAWYCVPSTNRYRNCILLIPETGSYRISGSFDLFPQHCLLPEFTPIQHTR